MGKSPRDLESCKHRPGLPVRERIVIDPYSGHDVVVTRDLGGGYTQTQLGPEALELAADDLARLLEIPDDDRPPPERIHVVPYDPAEDELL